ncbi:hypothetical protein BDM02DRAFT_578724 [Thelephora ganbajun]|uniref:Uncharacterized protein n=1 Tax=Thelephora ganbajun TaxID=370292 RepID=A0ACB6Z728_THEGA|nr:hypothetical protein BDM02DRAFT_578724 [Thelephora ganbajun]
MSPELLDPERFGLKKSRPTKESDCYALGMVIYEVLSRQTPFTQHSFLAIVWRVLDGERPGRPQGKEGKLFTDAIWGVLGFCWEPQPSDRANAKAVLLCLEGAPLPPRPSSPNMDEDSETDASYQSDVIASEPVLPFAQSDHGPPVLPRGSPPNVPSPTTPQDGGQLPDPPQTSNPGEERIVDRLTRGVQKLFKLP